MDLRGKLAIPTAKACVDIIAEAIGTMDIECLDEDGEQTDTPSYMEESMDGSPFMDTMISLQRSNLTYGNGYLAVGWSEAPG